MDCNINVSLSNRTKLLYNQADYDAMHHFVKGRLANLDLTFCSTMWDNFNCIMQDAIKRFVPVCTSSNKRNKPLWMTRKVFWSIKRKGKLWKKWRQSKNDTAYTEYRKQANKASKAVKLAKKSFQKKDSKEYLKRTLSPFTHIQGPRVESKLTDDYCNLMIALVSCFYTNI